MLTNLVNYKQCNQYKEAHWYPRIFTWNNTTFKGKTEIPNQFNLFFTNIGPELTS